MLWELSMRFCDGVSTGRTFHSVECSDTDDSGREMFRNVQKVAGGFVMEREACVRSGRPDDEALGRLRSNSGSNVTGSMAELRLSGSAPGARRRRHCGEARWSKQRGVPRCSPCSQADRVLDTLIDGIWGNRLPRQASRTLSVYVSTLRRAPNRRVQPGGTWVESTLSHPATG